MTSSLSRLSSLERRFVVGVFVVFIVVINVLFIWPRFDDWNATKNRIATANRKLATFKKEIDQMPDFERKVKTLEGQSAPVPPEDQGIEFVKGINTQAAQSGFIVVFGRMTEGTNQIFLEKSQPITVVAEESQLVDFLYNLGAGNSLIRARSLALSPDGPQRHKLNARITLVASYQKRTTTRSSASGTAAAKSTTSAKK